jgi:hypothetical protein
MPGFSIAIETQAGVPVGPGPIATASRWQQVRRLDRAGTVALDAPATDERTAFLSLRRYVRCRSQAGAWSAGIIETIGVDTEGRTLTASGSDLLRELAMRTSSFTELRDVDGGGDPIPIGLAEALDIIIDACNTQADPDWTLDAITYVTAGDTTSASTTIANVRNIANFENRIGGPIFGAGIPDGAIVTAVDAAAFELEIAPAATATASNVTLERSQFFYTCGGESILQTFIKIAEMTGTHFRLGTGREIVWLYNIHNASDVRAVVGVDPVAAESNQDICLITSLEYVQDASDVISHVHPWGSGSGSSRLGMANSDHPGVPDPNITTRTAPDGYTLDLDNNVIRRDDAQTDYGYSIRHQTFSDIGVGVATTDPDYDTALFRARDMLFDAGLEYLRAHSYPLESYRLGIAKLDREVLPGQTIRVIYNSWVDGYKWVSINRELLVLESTVELTATGTRTSGLVVSTLDRWPENDLALLVRMVRAVQQAQQHTQVAV